MCQPARVVLAVHARTLADNIELLHRGAIAAVARWSVIADRVHDAAVESPATHVTSAATVRRVNLNRAVAQVIVDEIDQMMHVLEIVEILRNVTVRSVLVFYLDHDDAPSVAQKMRFDDGEKLRPPSIDQRDEASLVRPELYRWILLRQNECRKSAELPLAARVWSETEKHEKIFFSTQLEKSGEISITSEIKLEAVAYQGRRRSAWK